MRVGRRILGGVVAFWLAGCGRAIDPTLATPGNPALTFGAGIGGSVGNGGDDVPAEQGSAWFLGPRTVRYCYEVSPEFGASPRQLETALSWATNEWNEYLTRPGLGRLGQPEEFPERNFDDTDPSLIFNHILIPHCDGSEDLHFYFGVENPEVTARKARFSHPLAFAQRLAYDIGTGWGKGYIWVQSQGEHSPEFPNWSFGASLRGILLHELGHVLGCAHVSGTIMDSGIVGILEGDQYKYHVESFHIDRRRMLILPKFPLYNYYIGKSGRDSFLSSVLMEVATIGSIARSPWLNDMVIAPIHILTVNGKQSVILDVREVGRERLDAAVFKMVFLRPGATHPSTIVSSTESATYVGRMIEGNHSRSVVIQYNGSYYRMRIVTWPEGHGEPETIVRF